MITLGYMVETTQWNPHKKIYVISKPFRLDRARTDAQNASIQHGNAAVYEMPAGNLIAKYRGGTEVDIHDGVTPVSPQ
jgi:hypothetical protein